MEDHPIEYERHKATEDHLLWQKLSGCRVLTLSLVCGLLGCFLPGKTCALGEWCRYTGGGTGLRRMMRQQSETYLVLIVAFCFHSENDISTILSTSIPDVPVFPGVG